MNICIKSEKKVKKLIEEEEKEGTQDYDTPEQPKEKEPESQWEYNLCTNIQFHPTCEVARFIRQNKETGEI